MQLKIYMTLYHLALEYDYHEYQESSCRKTSLLQDVYNALESIDNEKLDQAYEGCVEVVFY